MPVPVFCYRRCPDQLVRFKLEALIADEGGEVVMEAEQPVDGEIMLMAAFEDEPTADAFVGLARLLNGVSAEKEVSMRVVCDD